MREWPALTEKRPDPRLLFETAELAHAVNGEIVRPGTLPIHGGAVDSRRVERGNIFFALPGERTDGHLFLADAARRGAGALVISRQLAEPELAQATGPAGAPAVVLVDDGRAALRRAAVAWRKRFEPLVVGVTGSLAKTSTKEQTAEVLSEHWTVLRNEGNENNEIGLPLTLLRLGPEHSAAVLEMGMYTPGDIAQLAAIARPAIGVVTAVRSTHLSRAGSLDAIERGKRELVEALPAGGAAILNADDERVRRMATHAGARVSVLTYGFDPTADVTATDVESAAERGMRFTLGTPAGRREVAIRGLGRHSVHNALAAAAVGFAAGLELPVIVRGLARPWSVPHRSRLIDTGEWQLLDDTYNAAPDSMLAALDTLASLPGRHVAVLGEMLELGDASAEGHALVGAHAARTADVLVGVGLEAHAYLEAARSAGMAVHAVHAAADQAAALALLHDLIRPGDVVLLKASRGAELDRLVEELLS
jgi:UDP-N-acetylmuramoyl-tripeptide--D-alanyl-D-alanine ligase